MSCDAPEIRKGFHAREGSKATMEEEITLQVLAAKVRALEKHSGVSFGDESLVNGNDGDSPSTKSPSPAFVSGSLVMPGAAERGGAGGREEWFC